jgi:hypothetical protein
MIPPFRRYREKDTVVMVYSRFLLVHVDPDYIRVGGLFLWNAKYL